MHTQFGETNTPNYQHISLLQTENKRNKKIREKNVGKNVCQMNCITIWKFENKQKRISNEIGQQRVNGRSTESN